MSVWGESTLVALTVAVTAVAVLVAVIELTVHARRRRDDVRDGTDTEQEPGGC